MIPQIVNAIVAWSICGFLLTCSLGWLWFYDKAPNWFNNAPNWLIILVSGPLMWFCCVIWWIEIKING